MSRTKFLVAVKFPGNPVKNILPRPQCIGTADRGPICFYQERKIYFRFRYIIRGANTAVFSKPSVFGRTRRHRALICDSIYLSIYLFFPRPPPESTAPRHIFTAIAIALVHPVEPVQQKLALSWTGPSRKKTLKGHLGRGPSLAILLVRRGGKGEIKARFPQRKSSSHPQ